MEAEYYVPFLAHATMEPQNCTARVDGDKVEIWVPTQSGEAALAAAAKAAGVPPRNVVVHKTMLGGGFGRRGGMQDYVPHAVLIAKEMGVPVKTRVVARRGHAPRLLPARRHGADGGGARRRRHAARLACPPDRPFDPRHAHAVCDLGGVDLQAQEGFLDDMPYDVPNYLADYAMRNTHVPVGFWRCVNQSQNGFFKESFIDELAHLAQADPYAYRRKLIGKHKHADKFLAVLDAAAQRAGWGTPLPPGHPSRHRARTKPSGPSPPRWRKSRSAPAARCGCTASSAPSIAATWSIRSPPRCRPRAASSLASPPRLYGEITISDGRVEQSNFDDYPMLRIDRMPKVETVLVPSGGFWGGIGEPPLSVVAPAFCNAIFAATGKRIRSLPVKNHDLRKA